MKTLYLECNMGAAGDMLLSALCELIENVEHFIEELNNIGIPEVVYTIKRESKCGINGTQVEVFIHGDMEDEHMHKHHHDHSHNHDHEHNHHHCGMHDIEHIISHLNISENVKKNILKVYGLIAEAESCAHGKSVDEIHFHEVGTMDAIADITGVCMAIDKLGVDKIISSPICTGSGTVKCAHGILPVPAPATAYILRDVPIYSGKIKSELCTPTGAALLKYFASEYREMPTMQISKIGYGMGHKDFEEANCVRAMLGETEDNCDKIVELKCNLDDMTGEAIGFAVNTFFTAGALDVYTTAIGMKKNRPGILLTCMCRNEEREKFIALMFKHTTTLGIREYLCNRYTLKRHKDTIQTKYGTVRVKESQGWGVIKRKKEYDDIEKLAQKNNLALNEII